MNQLLKTIHAKRYSQVCLVGDFNFKDINWSTWSTKHGEESKEFKFIEAVRNCFLFQHIDKPTRVRGDDEPSLLDLLLTNEELQVSNVAHHAPLGKSDHSVISFDYHCYLDHSKPKKFFDYRNADVAAMKSDESLQDWKRDFVTKEKESDVETLCMEVNKR